MPKIKVVTIKDFKRFTDITVHNIPESAKLIVLVGPNGSGKSSFFEALNYWQSALKTGYFDQDYLFKSGSVTPPANYQEQHNKIKVVFHSDIPYDPYSREPSFLKTVYIRSAYRNEARFSLTELAISSDA